MSKNLIQRVFTAIIGAVILLGCVFYNVQTHVFIFGLICFFCLYEFFSMQETLEQKIGEQTNSVHNKFGLIFKSILLLSVYVLGSLVAINQQPLELLWWLVPGYFSVLCLALFTGNDHAFLRLGSFSAAILYIVLPLVLINRLCVINGTFEPLMTFVVLAAVWAHDVFAYFVGKTIGKHPLFKRISPKKTLEGSFGGFVGICLIVLILRRFTSDLTLGNWIVFCVIVLIFGTFGDLFESKLKRNAGIKDSGTILPGHGGFLDRFDAFLFVVPAILVFIYFSTY